MGQGYVIRWGHVGVMRVGLSDVGGGGLTGKHGLGGRNSWEGVFRWACLVRGEIVSILEGKTCFSGTSRLKGLRRDGILGYWGMWESP